MLKQKDIMDCLPLLASVLGNQYGVTVEIGGSEAYTDGKTIHLPALPLDSEPELITMIRGFADHEAAHIRETDFEILKKANLTPFQHNLFNILEDWRVEERLSARYPGCRENFRCLIQKLFGTQKAGDINPAFSILNTILLTVRSWSVDAIIPRRESVVKTMERQYPGLRKALEGILRRVRDSCKDTGDCIRYALELEQAILQWGSEQADAQQRRKKDESITKNTLDTTEVSLDALASMLNASSSDELPKGFGESLAERIELDSPKDRQKQLRVAVTGQKRLAELPPGQLSRIERQTAGLGFRLQGLIQAQKWLPVMPGVRGRLSSSLCHRLAVGNPRVFVKNGFRESPNTAVHILLDSSGSMTDSGLMLANAVCYAVGKALQGILGVNLGITAFPGASKAKRGTTVAPVLRHGEKLTTRFPEIAYGMTPMAESLWWVMQQMCLLHESRKIILIITDGEPDSIPTAQEAFKQAQKKGFECYGLGIMCPSIATLLPHASRVIETLPQLAPALFELLEGALRRNA